MRYLITHETVLTYPLPVREHHIELRLTPRESDFLRLVSRTVVTDPAAPLAGYTDCFGNRVEHFSIAAPHTRLATTVTMEVENNLANPFDFTQIPPAEQRGWWKQVLKETPALHDFVLHRSRITPDALKIARELSVAFPRFEQEKPVIDVLIELMAWVPTVLAYQSGTTDVHTDLLVAVKQGAGVCQDFAHLFIAVVRSWGVPARYVMGYHFPCDADPTEPADPLATHAWAEVLVPGGGWIGFDAVHNLVVNHCYVPVAVGRDSYDAAPQRGSFKGDEAGEQPVVTIAMTRL